MTKKIWIIPLAALVLVIAACEREVPKTDQTQDNTATDQATTEEPSDTTAPASAQPQASEDQASQETSSQAAQQDATAADPADGDQAQQGDNKVQYAGMTWYTDLQEAKKAAKEQNKQIFMNFSGSDWCVWCQRLDEEVLSKPAFQDQAKKDYVFLLVDFPADENKLSDDQKEKNRGLLQLYGVQGFPTVLLAKPDGQVYAMTGYQEGGPEAYLEHLNQLRSEKDGNV